MAKRLEIRSATVFNGPHRKMVLCWRSSRMWKKTHICTAACGELSPLTEQIRAHLQQQTELGQAQTRLEAELQSAQLAATRAQTHQRRYAPRVQQAHLEQANLNRLTQALHTPSNLCNSRPSWLAVGAAGTQHPARASATRHRTPGADCLPTRAQQPTGATGQRLGRLSPKAAAVGASEQ